MVGEAEARRAHLEMHRAEIDAGLEPAASRPRPASMSQFGSTGSARSATATTGCSSPASSISLVGTWMQQVAQAWLVLQLTHDPLWLGLVAVAQFGPVIVFGLFGGVIADQLPKRKTLIATQTVSMILAFALFGLTVDRRRRGLARHGARGAARARRTRSTCRPARHSPSRWSGARTSPMRSGSTRAVFNASRIVGPAIAGLLIGAFDISIAFLINGVSYHRRHRGLPR